MVLDLDPGGVNGLATEGPRRDLLLEIGDDFAENEEKFKKFMEEGGMSTTYGIRAEGWRKDKEADD